MPERERVTRMQAAVAKLVDGADMQVAELCELANPTEVEERIAVDDARDVPEQHAEAKTDQRDDEGVARRWTGDDAQRKRQRGEGDGGENGESEPDRAVHEKEEQQRRPERPEAERDARRCSAQAQRACDERPGQKQHERGGDQSQPQAHPVRRQKARHPEQGQRQQQDWRCPNAASDCPHGRSIRPPARAGRGPSRARNHGCAGACGAGFAV